MSKPKAWVDPAKEAEAYAGAVKAGMTEASIQTSALPDPRAGALRRTFTPNPSRNEAVPRKNAQRRTEPGHAPESAAPTEDNQE